MCGIVGAVNGKNVVGQLIGGLQRLEYRGYDSAGVAVLADGEIQRRRAAGKLNHLEDTLGRSPISGRIGIAHTRWATHGAPGKTNAHPHFNRTDIPHVAVVHNGIIENYKELRDGLILEGHTFESDTDTEVIPHLIAGLMSVGMDVDDAVHRALQALTGAYALGVLVRGETDRLFAARKGSPLVIGHTEDGSYIASDALALADVTDEVTYIEDGDQVVLEAGHIEVRDSRGKRCTRPRQRTQISRTHVSKGGYRHYMLKEIHEQPIASRRLLGHIYDPENQQVKFEDLPFDFAKLNKLSIIACGTSYYAGSIAKYWFEQFADLPVEVDIASEFRYRKPPVRKTDASLFISQSGETADTMAALRYVAKHGQKSLALVNVPTSTMAREADGMVETHAGPEIGVASTKAFTAQLTTLAALVVEAGRARGTITAEDEQRLTESLSSLPALMEQVLDQDMDMVRIARTMAHAKGCVFMGRGTSFPLAMEGALKLKEVTYIHAHGYSAGELKHGPIALVDEDLPVVVVAPFDDLFEKTLSNLQEVRARGGQILLITDIKGRAAIEDEPGFDIIVLPDCDPFVSPMTCVIPLQLLAYHVALAKGTDVDQPRNLAKSVTVE